MNNTNLPSPSAPFLDPNGRINDAWWQLLLALFNRTGGGGDSAIVFGPSSASDTDIAVFNGTTGLLIKDSGVKVASLATLDSPHFTGVPTAPTATTGTTTTQLATTAFVGASTSGFAPVASPAFTGNPTAPTPSVGDSDTSIATTAFVATSFAPLASPTFTGDPKAPTATLGDNDTSIATTAFVQAAIANLSSTKASFSAHNNGTTQSIPNNAFTVLTLGTKDYDVGTHFASNAWTPPAGRVVSLVGSVAMNTAVTTAMVVGVFKNGVEFKRGTQINTTAFTAVTVACQDIPNGTDVYDLRAFQNSGIAQLTSGSTSITYFQGTTIQA